MNQEIEITFYPMRIKGKVPLGITILGAARMLGVPLEGPCSGTGKCGKDIVQIRVNKVLDTVLACKTLIDSDVEVVIPHQENKAAKIVEGFYGKHKGECDVNPKTKKEVVRNNEGLCATGVLIDDKSVAQEDGDTVSHTYGIALDIGTTTLVASLVDLRKGEALVTTSALNPLICYGHDVMSRIKYSTSSKDGLSRMHRELISTINFLISHVCAVQELRQKNIYHTVAAGNTTMQHIFLNKEINGIGEYPYKTETLDVFTTTAKALGLNIAEYAPVTTFPCISAYVGGDIVSGLLAVCHEELELPALFIDIGTNGELALITEDKILATSTAAGPCFEGMTISSGMRAGDGAIEHVRFGEELLLDVIGGGEPKGICGSGLLDVVSELIKVGLLNSRGRLQSPDSGNTVSQQPETQSLPYPPIYDGIKGNEGGCKNTCSKTESLCNYPVSYTKYLFEKDRKRYFRLTDTVSISQEDIRQVQLAKAAIKAGIEVLLSQSHITTEDLRTIIIAGAFGYHARKESLFRIGMLPETINANLLFIGNSSLEGAVRTLINKDFIQQATHIARTAQVMELSQIPDFEHIYIGEMRF